MTTAPPPKYQPIRHYVAFAIPFHEPEEYAVAFTQDVEVFQRKGPIVLFAFAARDPKQTKQSNTQVNEIRPK